MARSDWRGVGSAPRERPSAPKLLSRDEVYRILKITPRGLYSSMYRGRFPRPAYGVGKRSLWREEDVFRGRR